MKRKVAAVVLCAAMTASMLGACGSTGSSSSADSASGSSASSAAEEGSSDGKKVEIEFVQVKREASESYDKVIAAFEEKYPNGSDESYDPDFDFYEGEPMKEWEAEADRANEIPVEMLMGNY